MAQINCKSALLENYKYSLPAKADPASRIAVYKHQVFAALAGMLKAGKIGREPLNERAEEIRRLIESEFGETPDGIELEKQFKEWFERKIAVLPFSNQSNFVDAPELVRLLIQFYPSSSITIRTIYK